MKFINSKMIGKGQSLFEVVVAMGVIAMVIVALVLMSSLSVRNSNFARNKTLATRFAEEGVEWLRGERDADFALFETRSLTTGKTYCLINLDWSKSGSCASGDVIPPATIFKREVLLTTSTLPDGSPVVEVKVTVSWTDQQGTHNVNSSTDFTDWKAV
jgi:Tfp pilus assembly protein PilV